MGTVIILRIEVLGQHRRKKNEAGAQTATKQIEMLSLVFRQSIKSRARVLLM